MIEDSNSLPYCYAPAWFTQEFTVPAEPPDGEYGGPYFINLYQDCDAGDGIGLDISELPNTVVGFAAGSGDPLASSGSLLSMIAAAMVGIILSIHRKPAAE